MKGNWAAFVRELKSDRGWRVVIASGIGYGLGVNVLPFFTLGAFVPSLESAFGWSRAQVQGSVACLTAATLVAAWLVGWLTDRYGVRKVAMASQLGLTIGLALLASTPGSLWFWYASWLLMSLLGLGTSPITWTRGIVGWFDAGRGLALALTLAGSGVAAMVAPVTVAILIQHVGWRMSYLALAVAVLFIALPATWRFFPTQSSRALTEDGQVVPLESLGPPVREIVTGYRFWLIFASAAMAGFAMTGLIANLVPLLTERGLGLTTASSFVGLLGMTVIIGRLTAGYALDRLWAPAVACVFLPCPALACVVLAQGTTDYMLVGLSVVLIGFATGAEFDLVPYVCARYFGMGSYSRVYALQWVGFTVAAGVAPAVFGYTYDALGSYAPILLVAAGLFVFAALVLLALGRYPTLMRVETNRGAGEVASSSLHTGTSGTAVAKVESRQRSPSTSSSAARRRGKR